MFTQCPQCSTAFRVTPQVLKQAGGRVRCGGCGNAFSAIDHLTEEPPGPDNSIDNPAGDDLQTDDKFAETSRQLLETLNELAGPDDVRIEDTGIEWRVLKNDEVIAADTDVDPQEQDVMTGTSGDLETADAQASQESLDLDEPEQEPQEERRYDDNTPLPDEFGDEEEYQYTPPVPKRRTGDHDHMDTAEFDEKQADLALSEPEDWTDLLDEVVDEGVVTDNIPLEVEEELAAIHSELSTKGAPASIEPEEDPVPADIDSQFEMQAEAMGIDISGIHETAKERSDDENVEDDTTVVDDAADDDLTDEAPFLDESEEGILAAETEIDPDNEELAAEAKIDSEDQVIAAKAESVDEEKEIATQAEIDPQEKDVAADDTIDAVVAETNLESTGEFGAEIDVAAQALAGEEDEEAVKDEEKPDDVVELSLEGDDEDGIAATSDIDEDKERGAAEDATTDAAASDEESAEGDVDIAAADNSLDEDEEATDKDEKIDFAATLIGMDDPSKLFDEDSGEVETIIMEGEFIHDSQETARLHAEKEARNRFRDVKSLVDTYAASRGMRGGRRSSDPAGHGVIAGTIFLALLLGGQLIHAYRETLSTYGLFNQTIGPVYRMLGNPVTPEWDIKGWQFEATNGSVADESEVLTIVSRIGNKSEQPLPYPLVHVSLTDRYEEIIGSRVLEPNEYLAGDLDPSKPVVFGENFTAVITIDAPSPDATGFKLNVCYRVNPTQVRCAIEDFKN